MTMQATVQGGCNEFVLAEVGRGRWVVACDGRLIAGAVLSSLQSAAAYAAALAAAAGRASFRVTVRLARHATRSAVRAPQGTPLAGAAGIGR